MNKLNFPIVTLIGQRNVGKSTLFNRLICSNSALVANYSGLTRDRQYGYYQNNQAKFIIVDTGGLDETCYTNIQSAINFQINLAIQESYIILFVIDGRCVGSSKDYNILKNLKKTGKHIIIVINKIDSIAVQDKYSLLWDNNYGLKDITAISAIHGYGMNKLLNIIFSKFSQKPYSEFNDNFYAIGSTDNIVEKKKKFNNFLSLSLNNFINLAVIGRPNSGKSTFVNYILKENRMIISDIPGTTRDSIYTPIVYQDKEYTLIDTAGIRKKSCISDISEQLSVSESFKVLKHAHVTLFMIDLEEGLVDQDLLLLNHIINNSKSLIIVINKWDNLSYEKTLKKKIIMSMIRQLQFLTFYKVHFISSLYGNGIKLLFKSIETVYLNSLKTINTALLTRIMKKAVIKYPPPSVCIDNIKKRRIVPKPKYVHIGGYQPITIIIHGTLVTKLTNSYRRYLKKYFYHELNLQGILIRFRYKNTINPFN